jgi:small conductance mechanosensitive channel
MKFDSLIACHFLGIFFNILVILIVTEGIVRLIARVLDKMQEISQSHGTFDTSHIKFFRHFVSGFIYFLGLGCAVSMIPGLKSVALSAVASSGVIALVVGFASQQAFSNIISGLFLGLFKPFVIGDKIHIAKEAITGTVEDITLRHTIIKTAENKHIMIPNSLINSAIIENSSWADAAIRLFIEIPVHYDADIDKATAIIQEVCLSFNTHKLSQRETYEVVGTTDVQIISLTPSVIILRAALWAKNESEGVKIKSELYKIIKQRFEKEAISWPRCFCILT